MCMRFSRNLKDMSAFKNRHPPGSQRKPHLHSTAEAFESSEERVLRLYQQSEGPLLAWLLDEARRRGQTIGEMASALGVTHGYINQLRSGLRKVNQISREFALSCAGYLGVPPIVVKVLAGHIPMSDFIAPQQSEEDAVSRAFEQMLADPGFRAAVPMSLSGLSHDAKKALVSLYANTLGHDVLGLREIPAMLRWVQRAAMIHDESEGAAYRGHRDVVNG